MLTGSQNGKSIGYNFGSMLLSGSLHYIPQRREKYGFIIDPRTPREIPEY